jgi:UDP-N-acetyl-alpha-D-quinovosamine dehydrogenase
VKCIVSGATGFIGRQLCQQLESRGYTVVGLSKSGAALASGRPTFAVDLVESDPGTTLLKGADVFFHLAGIAHQQAPDSAYTALNHQATLRLARLALAAGIRCFVFLSSVKAMGPSHSPDVREESTVSVPIDSYSLSKWQAECALRDAFSGTGMSIAIVRPALVYGVEAKGNLQTLATGVRWGLPRPPQGGRRSMIALEDLVELLCVIAERPPSGIKTWIACGQDSYSTRDIYDLLRAALGKERGVAWLPPWSWKLVSQLLDRILPRRGESTYDKLFGWELYSNAAVMTDTGWHPRLRLEDMLNQLPAAQRADT